MEENTYVPAHALYNCSVPWTSITINHSHEEIIRREIITWCVENIRGRWTMLGSGRFGFESGEDAIVFKMRFGFES